MKCVHFDLQFELNEWKSYEIVDWIAKCETIVHSITKIERNNFANISIDDRTHLTTTKFSKIQNYCDNESIFVIFAKLKCANSALQYWSNKWKLYVIVDWYAKCAANVQFFHQKIILMIDLKKFDAFSHSNVDLFQYFQLMKRISTIFSLINKFFRSITRVKRIYWTFFYKLCSIDKWFFVWRFFDVEIVNNRWLIIVNVIF